MVVATHPAADPLHAAGAAVTVRGLAPETKARLRIRAAHNARSMEAEARAILEAALAAPEEDPTDLASFARGLFASLGGMELELPEREPAREPLGFGEGESAVAVPVALPSAQAKPAPVSTRAAASVRKPTVPAKGRRR